MGARDLSKNILAVISKKPGLLSTEVAKATGIATGTVSATLSALTSKKLVKRASDYTDTGRQSFRYYPKDHAQGKIDKPKGTSHKSNGRSKKMVATISLPLKSGPVTITMDEARKLQILLHQLFGAPTTTH